MKIFMRLLVPVVLSLSLAACDSPVKSDPNFLIIIADDLGWNDLGAYGNSFVRTPNIDKLAANGIRFDNAFLTTSSCSASRASILTGKYPHTNQLMHLHQPLPASQATIARYLGKAGYYTEGIGKWHLGPNAAKDFDRVIENKSDTHGMQDWVERLRARPANQPFFFWMASYDPHRPYDDDDQTLPGAYDPDEIVVPDGFIDGPQTRQELAAYYREVSRFDRYTGEVIDELRRQGVLDNTVVIVMSDNGRPFHRNKMHLYDDGIKTPLIVYWPKKIPSAMTNSSLVSAIDLAPTLLKLAGLPVPNDFQGMPIPALFGDHDHVGHDYVFAERNWHGTNAHERAVRSRNFLYKENQYPLHGDCVQNGYAFTGAFHELREAFEAGKLSPDLGECFSERRDKRELFRIDNAQFNFRNLVEDPAYAEILAEHQRVLSEWRKATVDSDYIPHQP